MGVRWGCSPIIARRRPDWRRSGRGSGAARGKARLMTHAADYRSDRIIRFIEKYLVTPEGAAVGQPIRLREWQKDIIRQIYDTPTRQAIVSMGRKNGKTALIAMLVIAHVIGPEAERNASIFSSAQSRHQAGIVYDLAAKMVRMSRELSDPNMVVTRESAKELYSPLTGVRYKALAAEASTTY